MPKGTNECQIKNNGRAFINITGGVPGPGSNSGEDILVGFLYRRGAGRDELLLSRHRSGVPGRHLGRGQANSVSYSFLAHLATHPGPEWRLDGLSCG